MVFDIFMGIDAVFTLMHYNSRRNAEVASVFGYIIASADNLPKARQERFREFYCGLCRTLRHRRGVLSGLTLSYDMTFLAVLLNGLYEPGEAAGRERCVANPAKLHDYVSSPVMDSFSASSDRVKL